MIAWLCRCATAWWRCERLCQALGRHADAVSGLKSALDRRGGAVIAALHADPVAAGEAAAGELAKLRRRAGDHERVGV